MKMNTTITKSAIALAAVATLVAGFALPMAASAATVRTGSAGGADSLARVIARSDSAIMDRISAMDALSTRVSGMKNVPDSEKTNIANEVASETSSLTTLKAKIDADTDVTVARADEKTITGDYRIYALVIPQGRIVAAGDRITTVGGMETALQAKLQTRLTADQTAGKNVSALTAPLADISAKVSDANTQAANAESAVANLVPDQGNATIAASNKAALVAARADLKTGASDLKAARADIQTVVQGLKALK